MHRTIKRFRQVWSELEYAQQRLFEIRTGIPVVKPQARIQPGLSVEQLEALYALEQHAARP
jgi:hypothetical protein